MTRESGPERLAVARFIAKQVAKKGKVDEQELAEAISEVEIETQTGGGPFIKVKLVDPYYRLLTSEFVKQNEGRLGKIDVEFPESSGWWWRLAAVEVSNDVSQPNLTLTFEDRIVAWLREEVRYTVVPAGTQTRAQFVKALIDKTNLRLAHEGYGHEAIRAVIPSLNVLQEVEETQAEKRETVTGKNELGQETLTGRDEADEKARANKSPSVGKGSQLTVGGVAITEEQREVANILLGVAQKAKATLAATEALIFAGIAESRLNKTSTNSLGYSGVLSGNKSEFPNYASETTQMAEAFLFGGKGFQAGGAILLSRTSDNPVEIAVKVEVPSIWPENAYAAEANYADFLPEAQAIINEGGGVRGARLFQGSGGTTGESDVGQLTVGTPQDPYEDYWDAIVRLAQQVRWVTFTTGLGLTTYQRGRFFYYMDSFDQTRQKPAAYLEIPTNTIINAHTGKKTAGAIVTGMLGNWDDTTWEYQQQHKAKAHAVVASRLAKPATPTELRLPIICEPLDYQAGDVFIIRNSGTFNGRWVVIDTLRDYIEGPYTTLTLSPPLAPYPEPAASSTGPAGTQITGVQAVVEQAEQAYSEKQKYQYTEQSPARENNGTLLGPTPRTMDCSSFATLCYKAAGMPDPSSQGYSPIGNTTSMIAHMIKTTNPVPGDLIFYGTNEKEPAHVVVYIGNGNAIGMEDPALGLAEGPAWGAGNLGEGAGPPIGGEGVAWRLRGEYAQELHTKP